MPVSTAARISPVHGGLASPVNRITAPAAEAASWIKLPRIEVNDNARTSLYRIGDGTLSPLNGPMGPADYRAVLERGAIVRQGRAWAWTIPVILPVSDAEAAQCKEGSVVALVCEGKVFGKLVVSAV